MAPEVIRGENYGKKCDIWSLGCTIIEMSTGRPPWSNEYQEIAAAMFHIASANDIPQIPSHLSPECHDFLFRCFKRISTERPDTSSLMNHIFIGLPIQSDINEPKEDQRELEQKPITKPKEEEINQGNITTLHPINNLPTDLLLHIFSFLVTSEKSNKNAGILACVCKRWKSFIEDDMIWRYKTLLRWKKTKKSSNLSWKELYSTQTEHDKVWFQFSEINLNSNENSQQNQNFTFQTFKGKGHSKCINSILFSPQRMLIFTAGDDKKVKSWDLSKTKMIKTIKGHGGPVNSICFAENTHLRLFTASSDKVIKLWDTKDLKNKKLIKSFEGHTDSVTSIQVFGTKLASGSQDKNLLLWDINTGKVISKLEGHKSKINCLQFRDHTIITGSNDGTIKVFDTRLEKCTRTIIGHIAEVTSLQYDVDSNIVISGSGGTDKTIREWDLGSGSCIHLFKSNDGINCLYFDNNKIIGGSNDKTIKIWNRHQEKSQPRQLKGHSDSVLSLAFLPKSSIIENGTPDGTKLPLVDHLASGGKDKKLLLWSPINTKN